MVAVCGPTFSSGPLCCTAEQVESLRQNVDQAEALVSGCPACRNNFRNLFCSMTCGGDQSQYLDVVETQKSSTPGADGDVAVKTINYWVGEEFRQGLYDNCKNVKFGPGNAFAMDLLGGGAKDADAFLKYMGDVKPLVGSPFQINFPHANTSLIVSRSNSEPLPFNPTPRQCGDPDLLSRCACTDCPEVCATLPYVAPPVHHETCTVSLPFGGGRWISCFGLFVAVMYALGLVIMLTGYGIGLRHNLGRRKRAAIRHRNSGISVRSEGSGYERVRLSSEEQDDRHSGMSGANAADGTHQSLVGARARDDYSGDDVDDESQGSHGQRLAARGSALLAGIGLGSSSTSRGALSTTQPRSYKLNVWLSSFFYRLGLRCARYPYVTFGLAALFVALANLGWRRFDVETDPVELWVSPGSEARHRKMYFDEHFGPFYRTQQIFVMDKTAAALAKTMKPTAGDEWQQRLVGEASPVLNWERLQWWADVEAEIRTLKSSKGFTLDDVCFAPAGPNGPCVVQSIMGYFGDSLQGLNEGNWKDALDRCATSPAECLPAFGQPLKRNIILGGVPETIVSGDAGDTSAEGKASDARSLVTTWVVTNSLNETEVTRAQDWEVALEKLLFSIAGIDEEEEEEHPLGTRRRELGLEMWLSTESSLQQELARAGSTDVVIVVLSYVFMFLYASLTLGGGSSSSSASSRSNGLSTSRRPSGNHHRSGLAGRILSFLPSRSQGSMGGHPHSWSRRLFVNSKFALGLFGIVVVIAAVSSAVGLFSAVGVKVTLVIVEVLPFLLLAVGVDNVFLLANEMDRQNALASTANPYATSASYSRSTSALAAAGFAATDDSRTDEESIEDGHEAGTRRASIAFGQAYHVDATERAARTLSKVGPSILLSASVQVAAFLLGATIPMPAVRHFALYAAASMAFVAALQCTVFVAAMALDADRTEAERIDCLPCLKIPGRSRSGTSGDGTAGGSSIDYANVGPGTLQGLASEGFLGRFVRRHYAPWLIKPSVKKFILVVFAALFAVSLVSVRHVEMGLDQRLALPEGSYLRDYFDGIDAYLDVGPPVYFVVRGADPATREAQQSICGRFTTCEPLSLANTLEGERRRPEVSFLAEPASSWLDDMLQWLNPALEMCCRVRKSDPSKFCGPSDGEPDCQPCFEGRDPGWNITLQGMPEGQEFMRYLEQWLKSPTDQDCPLGGQAAYSAALSIQDGRVTSSHFRTFHTPLRSQADFIDALASTERMSKDIIAAASTSENGKIDVFAYSVFSPFFDQYLYLDRLALQLLGGSLVAIIAVTTLLLGSLWTALIVAACVSNAVLCVAASMAYLGIGLNALTLVNLAVCSAICVEFCAHVARAFMRASSSANGGGGAAGFSTLHNPSSSVSWAQKERDERAWAALVDVGPSVISGITGTKLVGISVLFWAHSDILKLYYASLWFVLIITGALHGLVLLPVALSLFGGQGYASGDDEAEVSRRLRRAQDSAEFRPFGADAEEDDSEEEYY